MFCFSSLFAPPKLPTLPTKPHHRMRPPVAAYRPLVYDMHEFPLTNTCMLRPDVAMLHSRTTSHAPSATQAPQRGGGIGSGLPLNQGSPEGAPGGSAPYSTRRLPVGDPCGQAASGCVGCLSLSSAAGPGATMNGGGRCGWCVGVDTANLTGALVSLRCEHTPLPPHVL